MKAEIKDKYKVTKYWGGEFYIVIALKWDYEKGTVQISMPSYVCAALNSFQHNKPKIPQDSPYPWTQSIYKKNNQMLSDK